MIFTPTLLEDAYPIDVDLTPTSAASSPDLLRARVRPTALRMRIVQSSTRQPAQAHAARAALPGAARMRDQAGALHARFDLPCHGRPPPGLADPQRVARRRAKRPSNARRRVRAARGFAQGYQTLEDGHRGPPPDVASLRTGCGPRTAVDNPSLDMDIDRPPRDTRLLSRARPSLAPISCRLASNQTDRLKSLRRAPHGRPSCGAP